jgi:hypothetical protein
MSMHGFHIWMCAGAAALAGTWAAVGQDPIFAGLGFPPGAGSFPGTRALSISCDGDTVVGSDWLHSPLYPNYRGLFIWTSAGMTSVSPGPWWSLEGAGVSDGGLVVGSYGAYRAPGIVSGFRVLGTVFSGTDFWRNYGVSCDGQWVVGMGLDNGAFRWSAAAGYEIIGGVPEVTVGRDITGDGALVVGSNLDGVTGGFVWTSAGGFQLLGGLPGVSTPDCALYAVADHGALAVGCALNAAGNPQPVRWIPGRGLRLISNLAGWDAGMALDVSGDGEVIVGNAMDALETRRAFVWDRVRGTRDLKAYLVQLGSADVSGWTLWAASGISLDGRRIAGFGVDPQGRAQAFIARVPAYCYANCDISIAAPVLSVADFTCFLQRFAVNDPYANCDESTSAPALNVADFTCFLQRYAAGCP